MVLAEEAQRTEELRGAYRVVARTLRSLRPEGISVDHARQVQDLAVALEKSSAALKILVAARAAEGKTDTTAAADLARKTGTSKKKAKDALDASKNVADQPSVAAALKDGRLSEDQTTAISDAVDKNPDAAPALLSEAEKGSLNSLRDACGRAKADADRDEEATHRRHHAQRSFRLGTDWEGRFWGSILGPTKAGAEFGAFFQPFQDAVFNRNRRNGIHDTQEQRNFDALLDMARAAHANVTGEADAGEAIPMGPGGPPAPAPAGGEDAVKPPATVYVVADFDRLVGRHPDEGDAAYIAGHGPIPTSVVREIMDDAFLVGVITKGTQVHTVRRFGRHIPAVITDALRLDHRFRCSTPGCHNWARLERDHVHPVGKGGETSRVNLDLPCDDCHDRKTRAQHEIWDQIPYRDTG